MTWEEVFLLPDGTPLIADGEADGKTFRNQLCYICEIDEPEYDDERGDVCIEYHESDCRSYMRWWLCGQLDILRPADDDAYKPRKTKGLTEFLNKHS